MSRILQIAVPESTLVGARAGDERAQAELYALFAPAVFALLKRLVPVRADAEDLFQDTMIRMLDKVQDYRGEAPFGAWLRQIAIHRALMHLRSPWQRARLELARPEEHDDARDVLAVATGASTAELIDLDRGLARLPALPRAVVWLYDVEGYTHEEIAQAFGRTVSFSKSQLARAHRRLGAGRDRPRAVRDARELARS